ncbi:MAG: hypothetical protein WB507_00925 [Solirubrobacterales bacterium]
MRITVGTELSIPAGCAYELAQRPATIQHVLWPWLTITPETQVPERIVEGACISLHLRWLGMIPGWTHQIRIERFTPEEIVSHEYGGPIAVWNHRLTFAATSPTSCRYTDTVEIQARRRVLTPLAAMFAALMYRYRQARWRALARVLAA